MSLNRLIASLENEDTSGEFNKEIEHVFYARITDFKQLDKADSVVRQEQWEIKLPLTNNNAAKGSLRVRSIKEKDKPTQYVYTTKIALNESGDKMEVTTESNSEQFVLFKFLAAQGMIKNRYTFNLENGLKWEIDVYFNEEGNFHQWCKIDFEVPDRSTPVPDFPIEFYDVIKGGAQLQRGSAEDKRVSELYDRYFLTKNQFRKNTAVEIDREVRKVNTNKVEDEVLLD